MVSLCDNLLNADKSHNKDLNKSKTKCIVFSNKEKQTRNLSPIVLYGNNLPWVQTVMHLGCTLQSNNSMSKDTMNKRGIFIGKVNSLLQELHFASPEILMKIINTNACSFYGSPLWNYQSKEFDKIMKSWNVTIRNIFRLDNRTH